MRHQILETLLLHTRELESEGSHHPQQVQIIFIFLSKNIWLRICKACKTISNLKGIDNFQVNMHHRLANIPLSHQDTFKDSPLPNHPRNK